jgi:apurinic endonuclease APN1
MLCTNSKIISDSCGIKLKHTYICDGFLVLTEIDNVKRFVGKPFLGINLNSNGNICNKVEKFISRHRINKLYIIAQKDEESIDIKKLTTLLEDLVRVTMKNVNYKVGNRILYFDSNIKIGCHITKKNSLFRSLKRMLTTPLTAFQVFVSNPRSLSPLKINNEIIDDLVQTKEFLSVYQKYMCIHGSLTINLCGGTDDKNLESKTEIMLTRVIDELDYGAAVGVGVIIHTGSHKNSKKGIDLISQNIQISLSTITENTKYISNYLKISPKEFIKRRKIILENSAGEGSKLGKNVGELGLILNNLDDSLKEQVRFCIDTAHIFGSGVYNFGKSMDIERFYKEFDDTIGLQYLELFHLNDSRVPFNSKKDRHENLCFGFIFEKKESQLKKFIEYAIKNNIVLIGEPPHTTKDGNTGPGFKQDYKLISSLCNLNKITYF